MNKCKQCEIRKVIAKAFDFHWMNEDDCPMQCPKEEDNTNEP